MVFNRFTATVSAFVVLVAGFALAEERSKTTEKGTSEGRLEALAAKLNLNDQQKSEMLEIRNRYKEKAEPLEEKLWSERQEERQQVRSILNNEQREKLPSVMRAEKVKVMNQIAEDLGVSGEQKQRLQKIFEKYAPKFEEISAKQGETAVREFRHLRHEAWAAFSSELTPEQRVKLPHVVLEEFHKWHNPQARNEFIKDISDKLNLNDKQRAEFKQICDENTKKIHATVMQLKELRKNELAAMDKVLSPEQREKLHEMLKVGHEGKESK